MMPASSVPNYTNMKQQQMIDIVTIILVLQGRQSLHQLKYLSQIFDTHRIARI